MRRWFACSLTLAIVVCTAAASAVDYDALALAAASITKDELKSHVDVLSDDSLEGREMGSRGGRAAGNYLLKAFEQHGTLPAGEGGTYFQAFNGAARNVLAMIEGSDPQLKQQVIVVSAHYDHVGYGRSNNSFGPLGYIHNGADDNASGVAGLLEILDAIKRLPTAPRRSILLACWDGEEAGLVGSRHWMSRPTVPLSRVVMDVNMDMIGRMRGGRIEVYGTRTAHGLRRIVSEANQDANATLVFDWRMRQDSDHYVFYERRIPLLMFHTGLHEDYHRPSDDAHRINHEGLTTASRLAFATVVQLADMPRVPAFRDACQQEQPAIAQSLEQPATPPAPRFGMPFRVEPGEPPAVILAGLTPGSPAERAGLKAGDQLIEFRGKPVVDPDRLRLELLAASGQTTLVVEREGADTPLLFKVTPQGEPVRVGIMWRMDEGEPGTAVVTHVIYGSAAYAAGIKIADRIYSVGGLNFWTQDELVAHLTNATSPLEVVVERDGRLRSATLTLIDEPPAAE